jgi:hypothetical protein
MTFSVLLDEIEYKNVEDRLSSIYYRNGQELELRFGSFNEKNNFFPGVSQKDFYRLLENLRKSSEFRERNLVETKVSYYKFDKDEYRVIETIKNNSVISRLVQSKKSVIRPVDVQLFPYAVRLALSFEKTTLGVSTLSK